VFDEVEFEGAIYEVERVEADGGMWLSPAPPDWSKGAELLDIAHYEGMNCGAYCCCKECDRAYLDDYWWPYVKLIVPAPPETEDQHFSSGYEE
jgi:hypothetical protein